MELVTDLRGRLTYFRTFPPDAEPSRTQVPAPDWPALFREAGLDISNFSAAEPTRQEAAFHDVRAAWSGVLSDYGNTPVRVEAAALGGRRVFCELVLPWDHYWNVTDPAAQPRVGRQADTTWARAFSVVFLIVMPIVTATFAVRNWLSSRGDRRGGFRLAVAVFFPHHSGSRLVCCRISTSSMGHFHGRSWAGAMFSRRSRP